MPAPRIFLTVSGDDLCEGREAVLKTLRALGCAIVDQAEHPLCWKEDELLAVLQDCQALICLVGTKEDIQPANDAAIQALGAQAAWRLAPRDLAAYAVLWSSDSPCEPRHHQWVGELFGLCMEEAPSSSEELRRLCHPHYRRVDRVTTQAELIEQVLAYGEQWSALGWEVVNPALVRTALIGKPSVTTEAQAQQAAKAVNAMPMASHEDDDFPQTVPLPMPHQETAPSEDSITLRGPLLPEEHPAQAPTSGNETRSGDRDITLGGPGDAWRAPPSRLHAEAATPSPPPPAVQPESAPSMPTYPPEQVQFTVYRPRSIRRETWRPMLVYAHLDDGPDGEPTPLEKVRAEVKHLLGEQAQDYSDVTKDSRSLIPREAEIQFVPQVPGVRFNPPSRSFFWSEGMDLHKEEFRVRALQEAVEGNVTGTLTVYLGVLIVAELPLRFQVTAQVDHALLATDQSVVSAKPYRNIFPSYSRKDDAIVHQLEAYATTMGDRFLKDVTTLRAGEEWSPRLMELIQDADVFQLFWSERSANSTEVEKEWRQALRQPKPNFIRPTYWEEPMPPAPAEMSHLHFHRLKVPPSQPPPMPASTQSWTPPVTIARAPGQRPVKAEPPPMPMASPGRWHDSDQGMTSTSRPALPTIPLPAMREPTMAAPPMMSASRAAPRRRLPPWVAMLGMVAFIGAMMVMWDFDSRRTAVMDRITQSEADAHHQQEMDDLRNEIQRRLREGTTGAQPPSSSPPDTRPSPSNPSPPSLPPPDSSPGQPTLPPPTMPPLPPRPAKYEIPARLIVIDPGHGGQRDTGSDREHSKSSSNNATSPKLNLIEKDLTLDLARRIAARIEQSKEASTQHVEVKLTRDKDINPDFAERAKIAADGKAKCFVAIHFNASDNHAATGPRAIVQQRSKNPNFDADVEFGEKLSQAVEAASKLFRVTTPKASLHDDHELHDGIGSYLFYQLNLHPETKMIPSCHLEVDFMDNVEVESVLLGARRDAVFDAWAEAIANALIAQVK